MPELENQNLGIRDMRDGDWYWISRRVLEDYASKIGIIGLALYNAYTSYARNKGKAFPSQETISKKLGISVKTIRKYNKILAEAGLISIESGKNKGIANVITLLKIEGGKELPKGYVSSSHLGRGEVPTKEKNIKENTNVAEQSPADSSSLVKAIISYFKQRTREVKGFEPEISWAKEGSLVKQRLKKYSLEELKDLINWYLDSEISEKLGDTLAICVSTKVINLWKAETTPR